ncbi:MAG: electron transfer flavoprotein subunit alpha/FixB family protein [Eubacterium sp.]|nr:electron transfer flavoprotein subunit alpha/FixB family protein [Eubacterium sp.]
MARNVEFRISKEEANGVWVVAENRQNQVQKVTMELIGSANKLAADLGQEVTCVLVGGPEIEKEAQRCFEYGAKNVLLISDPLLEDFASEPYTKAITNAIIDKKPNIVLFGASSIGRDIAPRVAGRIHTGLTADCTGLDIDDGNNIKPEDKGLLRMTRPAFGGNIMATILIREYRPQMATVRPGVMPLPERVRGAVGNLEKYDAGLTDADMNIEILKVELPKEKPVDITNAKVLVSGGRGMGGPEGYITELKPLAEQLGGEYSSSRIGVDSGWVEKNRQVGQTGKTVRPNLYMACGISGAIQHLAGMEDSEFIIAINKDAACPMMQLADLGVVGDLHKVVPKLTEAIIAYKKSQSVGDEE